MRRPPREREREGGRKREREREREREERERARKVSTRLSTLTGRVFFILHLSLAPHSNFQSLSLVSLSLATRRATTPSGPRIRTSWDLLPDLPEFIAPPRARPNRHGRFESAGRSRPGNAKAVMVSHRDRDGRPRRWQGAIGPARARSVRPRAPDPQADSELIEPDSDVTVARAGGAHARAGGFSMDGIRVRLGLGSLTVGSRRLLRPHPSLSESRVCIRCQ